MSARRSRMSLGPGSLPALGNASGRANRRTSFGGGSGSGDESNNVGAEPKKDRRAMLDEWRKSRASNNNSGAGASASNHPPKSAPSPSSRPSYSQSSYSNNNNKLSPIIASPNVDNNNSSSYSARSQYDDLHNMNVNNNRSYEQQQQEQQPVVEKPVYSKPPSSAPSRVVQEKENPAAADDMSGLTALERYRLRKQRQQQQQQAQGGGGSGNCGSGGGMGTPQKSYGSPSSNNLLNSNNSSSLGGTPTRGGGRKLPPPLPPSHSGSSHNGEEEDAAVGVSTGGYGASSTHNLGGLGTPSRRGKSRGSSAISLGGAQRRVRRRTSLAPSDLQSQQQQASHNSGGETGSRKSSKPLLPPSYPGSNERSVDKQDGDEPQQQQFELDEAQQLSSIQHPTPTNTVPSTTTNNFSQESHDSIDSAALKSRLQVMQKRIDNLEREKFELSMSKAPLEARIRQKEDMWLKERERLMSEIENYQHSSKDVDERYRELEMKNEALEEQNSRLRLEARASASNGMAGGSDSNGGNKDSWGERLKTNNEIKDLRKEVKNKDDEIKSLRIEKVSLESEVFGCQQEIETLERNYDELEKDYQELDSSKSTNIEAEIQLQALTTEHTATTAQLNATCADLEELKTRNKADLQAKEENWKSRESQLLFEMSVLKSRAGKSVDDDGDVEDDEAAEMDPAILKARIEERDRRITELEEQLLSGEQLRRALHNRIQELRGNIRVYVRTRPFLPNDGAASRQSSIDFQPDGESLTIQGKHVGEGHAFKFDKVFAPSTGQDMVFDEVSEFVQSALDGYNVCLFSYGQTGSGKTHTMQGSGNGAMRGIIPRAVEQILSQAAMMQSQRWTFTMKASFLEIYNEDLRDLLVMMNSDGSMKPRDTRTTTKLSIKRNTEGKSFVDGINMVDIDVENKSVGLGQLEAVMTAAARARSVATTKMNAQSSRSHSVFMLHLCGSNEESGTVVQGALNLCDLAGSERLDRSGAGSDAKRLKETQAINKSLSSLGDVFTSLANGSKHIPFRNSKLTYLLQDCLSGDGKALMFVNLSPTLASSQESLCSLRFAQRVNSVELGKANKNVQFLGGRGSSR